MLTRRAIAPPGRKVERIAVHSTETIRATRLVTFEDVAGPGRCVESAWAGPDGTPVLLSRKGSPKERARRLRAEVLRATGAAELGRLHYHAGEEWWSLDLRGDAMPVSFVQPLGRSEWLVKGPADRGELNTFIYDAGGSLVRSMDLGGLPVDLQVARDRRIWLAFLIEDVLRGQALADGCVVAADPSGACLWAYQAQRSCYALNVCPNGEVWFTIYDFAEGFSLHKMRGLAEQQVWSPLPVRGSHAVAVDRGRALFAGSYEDRASLFLVDLATMTCECLRPVGDDGDPLLEFCVFGRGSRIFVETLTALYAIDLAETPA